MQSRDIAWLAIASVLGFRIVTGLAVADVRPAHSAPAPPATVAAERIG